MAADRFSIIDAVKNAYIFVWHRAFYLLRLAAMPVCLSVITAVGVQSLRPTASAFEAFLWNLPTDTAAAWFIFAQTRLLILNEGIERLPRDPAFMFRRAHFMRMSITLLLLYDMGVTAAVAILQAMTPSNIGAVKDAASAQDVGVRLGVLLLVGGLVWGVRFSVLPLVAAVGYPLRDFLRRTQGMMFSLRLLALGMLCLLPVAGPILLIVSVLLPENATDMSQDAALTLIVAGAIISIFVQSLLNAAAAFALKDMLGRRIA